MNWLERRAIERSIERLRLPPEERPLDFEVGKVAWAILPEPFSFPLPSQASRIDLVVTERALFIHVAGVHARYGFADIMEADLRGDRKEGYVFALRMMTGARCQVPLGRTPRRGFHDALAEQFHAFQATRDPAERAAYAARVTEIAAIEATEKARREVLDRHKGMDGFPFTLGFAGRIHAIDGTVRGGGLAGLELNGLWIWEAGKDATQYFVIAYEVISNVVVSTDGRVTGHIDDPSASHFEVWAKEEADPQLFAAELRELVATGLNG